MMEHELQRHFVDIQSEVIVGFDEPAALISRVAEEERSDLVVVGSHGRRGFVQLFTGSFAESLLSVVRCPVMILGPNMVHACASPQTVLLPLALDSSDDVVVRYAARFDWRLVAVHVRQKESMTPSQVGQQENEVHRLKMCTLLKEAGLHPEEADLTVLQGDVATQVAAHASAIGADLILVEALHEGTLAGHLSGRVLTELIRQCDCPVLAAGPHFAY